MVTWFIGQRVRVVRPNDTRNMGITGNITNLGFWKDGDILPCGSIYEGHIADCVIHFDRESAQGFIDQPAHTSQLEPILPEGAQPSEFSFTELMDNLGVVVA